MRIEFRPGFPGKFAKPGDYCEVPPGVDPRPEAHWYLVDPTGGAGAICEPPHAVTLHSDGEISVQPSLVMPSGWHGFMVHGALQ